jgi:hypothetical protein
MTFGLRQNGSAKQAFPGFFRTRVDQLATKEI